MTKKLTVKSKGNCLHSKRKAQIRQINVTAKKKKTKFSLIAPPLKYWEVIKWICGAPITWKQLLVLFFKMSQICIKICIVPIFIFAFLMKDISWNLLPVDIKDLTNQNQAVAAASKRVTNESLSPISRFPAKRIVLSTCQCFKQKKNHERDFSPNWKLISNGSCFLKDVKYDGGKKIWEGRNDSSVFNSLK